MSMPSTVISKVRVLCPESGTDVVTSLRYEGRRITHIGDEIPTASVTIDGSGKWLMPGIIDLCARLREPGSTHKASIASEAQAALAAGITTLVMPPDTRPVADNAALVDRIHTMSAKAGAAQVRVLGALTTGLHGEALGELAALKAAGVVGVSNGLQPMANLLVARRALEYAHGLGLTVHVVALDAALANGGCAHEGSMATKLGLAAIPVAAEVAAIRGWISLVEDTGAAIHLGRLSSARALELVVSAKARGLPVTADVAAHQLFLTDAAIEGFNAQAHVIPPLRSEADRQALRRGVASGAIDAICSDHQPHEADAKINPFPLTEPGISALETLLPLALKLVHEGLLSPLAMAACLTRAPAGILRLPAPRVAVGTEGSFILLDPAHVWQLRPETMQSCGRNTPFAGTTFAGGCVQVFC